jgi:hypothetical protein
MVIVQRRGAGGISPEKDLGQSWMGTWATKNQLTLQCFSGSLRLDGRITLRIVRTLNLHVDHVFPTFLGTLLPTTFVFDFPHRDCWKSRSENRTKQNPVLSHHFLLKNLRVFNRSGDPLGQPQLAQLSDRNFFEGMVERKLKRAFKITDYMESLGCYGGPKSTECTAWVLVRFCPFWNLVKREKPVGSNM